MSNLREIERSLATQYFVEAGICSHCAEEWDEDTGCAHGIDCPVGIALTLVRLVREARQLFHTTKDDYALATDGGSPLCVFDDINSWLAQVEDKGDVMADLTPTQLAEEFARLNAAFHQAIDGDRACQAANDLAAFAGLNADAIAAALTEWAQQEANETLKSRTEALATLVDAERHRALEACEQACRERAMWSRQQVEYHFNPFLEARAKEADECAEAIARLKEQG